MVKWITLANATEH